jgi:hypothetical protein
MLQADALEMAQSSDDFMHVIDLLRSESTWRAKAFRYNSRTRIACMLYFCPAPVVRILIVSATRSLFLVLAIMENTCYIPCELYHGCGCITPWPCRHCEMQ